MSTKLQHWIIVGLLFTSCVNQPQQGIDESLEAYSQLEKIKGAENTSIIVNKGDQVGRNSTFQIELSGISDNSFLENGKYDGWCLEWDKPMRSNNDIHRGVKWYSSIANESWKPLNYFFSIKDELLAADPALTFRELQGVIWSLAGFIQIASPFDIDKIDQRQLPSNWFSDGQPLFDKEKIKAIVRRVKDEFDGSLAFRALSKHDGENGCYIGETDPEEQNICIEPPEDIEIDILVEDLGLIEEGSDQTIVKNAFAVAINDHGDIVGNQRIWVCEFAPTCDNLVAIEEQSFSWFMNDGLKPLPIFNEGSAIKTVSDVNNNRQVVGFQEPLGAVFIDYPIPIDPFIKLGQLLGSSDPYGFDSDAIAINEQGQVAGFAKTSFNQTHAFVWDKQNGITDLGVLPGHLRSEASDINNSGQVVGWSQGLNSNDRRYFIWDMETGMLDLGSTPIRSINNLGKVSSSLAINDLGQTVNGDGFLYDPVLGPIKLYPLPGSESCNAVDLNNFGHVVGSCSFPDANTRQRAVKWTIKFKNDKIVAR